MPAQKTGRTPRQIFGEMVRFYRDRAGVSRAALGRAIHKSDSLMYSIEKGDRVCTVEVTRDIERELQTDGALTHLRNEMAEGLTYQAFPLWFLDWTLREAEATKLRWFQPLIVPGLLQTEAYARAIYSTRFRITKEEISEQVAARMKRQEMLTRENPPSLWVILDEWLLRRPVGGPQVMLEQVNRLIEAARQPHIAIEIIPASLGAHEGLGGAFAIADFHSGMGASFQEGVLRGQPLTEPEEIEWLDVTWDTLRGETLPRAASLALLEEAAKAWTSAAT